MKRCLAATYVYTDEEGSYLFEKRRYKPKTFGYWCAADRSPGGPGVACKPEGADNVVYRLPDLLGGVAAARAIHWVEGEKDADALVSVGQVATSCHQGAGNVTSAQARWFVGARRVYVWMDKDWYGRSPHPEVGAYDAALRANLLLDVAGLRPEQVRIVRARGEGNKDAADHLAAGFPWRDAVAVDEDWLARWARRHRPAARRALGYTR